VYTLIASALPFFLLSCVAPLIERLANLWIPVALPYPLLGGVCLFSAAAASVYRSLAGRGRAGDLRGALAVAGAAYLAGSLLRLDRPMAVRLLPGVGSVSCGLCALYVWFQVLRLRRVFAAREAFERGIAAYDGDQLQSALREDEELLGSASRAVRAYRSAHMVQLAGILALASLCAGMGRLPLVLYCLLIILAIGSVLLFAVLEVFEQEQYYAGEGIRLSASQRSKRFFAMLVFTGAAALTAAAASAPHDSILPFSLITGFLAWVLSLFPKARRIERPLEAFEPPLPEMGPAGFSLPEGLADAADYTPWPFWDYLRYGVLGLLLIGFTWFMVKPLMERGLWARGFGAGLKRLFGEWLTALSAAAASFRAALRTGSGIRLNRAAGNGPDRSAGLGAVAGRAKRREIQRGAGLFARLIFWGEEVCGVRWTPSVGPAEYCALLAAAAAPRFPALPGPILRCGDLFERALYAEGLLSPDERAEFAACVKAVAASS
jgi:hypothetical protein